MSAKRLGFTLIEVLIVVAIMGIAAAFIVPHMLSAGTLGIQAAARTVIADLLYAQNEAIVQQRQRGIIVNTNEEKYWLTDENGDLLSLQWRVGGDNLIDFREDSRFSGVTLSKVTMDSGGNAIFYENAGPLVFTFNELGTPIQGGGTHIGLIAGDQRFVITVADFTGRVTVRQVN